jgi:NADH:ubiquinone oxidoreductase subunit 4 (subunit M)
MANISFPGTSNFVGEFLILLGSFSINSTITFLGAICVILGSVYSLWLLNRIIYGNFKVQYTKQFLDISLKEFIVFLPLLIGTILIGLYPNFFLISIHMSINNLIELMCF